MRQDKMKTGWHQVLALGLLQFVLIGHADAGTRNAGTDAGGWRGGSMMSVLPEDPRAGSFAGSRGIPQDRLIEMVQRRFNARVVRVTVSESGGRRIYEMRLLSDQRVWTVRVDAETGQVLEDGS